MNFSLFPKLSMVNYPPALRSSFSRTSLKGVSHPYYICRTSRGWKGKTLVFFLTKNEKRGPHPLKGIHSLVAPEPMTHVPWLLTLLALWWGCAAKIGKNIFVPQSFLIHEYFPRPQPYARIHPQHLALATWHWNTWHGLGLTSISFSPILDELERS